MRCKKVLQRLQKVILRRANSMLPNRRILLRGRTWFDLRMRLQNYARWNFRLTFARVRGLLSDWCPNRLACCLGNQRSIRGFAAVDGKRSAEDKAHDKKCNSRNKRNAALSWFKKGGIIFSARHVVLERPVVSGLPSFRRGAGQIIDYSRVADEEFVADLFDRVIDVVSIVAFFENFSCRIIDKAAILLHLSIASILLAGCKLLDFVDDHTFGSHLVVLVLAHQIIDGAGLFF